MAHSYVRRLCEKGPGPPLRNRRARTTDYTPTDASIRHPQISSGRPPAPSRVPSVAGQIAPKSRCSARAANLHPHPANCTSPKDSNRTPFGGQIRRHGSALRSTEIGRRAESTETGIGHSPPSGRGILALLHSAVPARPFPGNGALRFAPRNYLCEFCCCPPLPHPSKLPWVCRKLLSASPKRQPIFPVGPRRAPAPKGSHWSSRPSRDGQS